MDMIGRNNPLKKKLKAQKIKKKITKVIVREIEGLKGFNIDGRSLNSIRYTVDPMLVADREKKTAVIPRYYSNEKRDERTYNFIEQHIWFINLY